MLEVVFPEHKIMPGIGCMDKRKYVEAYLKGLNLKAEYIKDPCIFCYKRAGCYKPVVQF